MTLARVNFLRASLYGPVLTTLLGIGCTEESEHVDPRKETALERPATTVTTVAGDLVVYIDWRKVDPHPWDVLPSGGRIDHLSRSEAVYGRVARPSAEPFMLSDNWNDPCSWTYGSHVLPAPDHDSQAGTLRLRVVSMDGCVRVVDVRTVDEAVETVWELQTELTGDLMLVESAHASDSSTVIMSGSNGGWSSRTVSELRILELSDDGLKTVNEFSFPDWRLQYPLIKLSEHEFIGLDAYRMRGFRLRKDANAEWVVESLSDDDLTAQYLPDINEFATPLGSQSIYGPNPRGTVLLVGGEKLVGPALTHGDVRCGWVRRDTGDIHLLLNSGSVVRLQSGPEGDEWVQCFRMPEEFLSLVDYKLPDWSTSFGATLREGEIWMARGKDRVVLMRMDLDGDDAPEWEWLVNE